MSEELHIAGDTVRVTVAEGLTATMGVREFVDRLAPRGPGTGDLVIPDGVRMLVHMRNVTVMVWELHPAVHRVRWIAAESAALHPMPGRSVTYRERSLSLPYILVFATFMRHAKRGLVLSERNEAYFRTAPYEGPDDELCFPALLNISCGPATGSASLPLAWICTQFTDLHGLAREPQENRRVRRSLKALRSTLLESGFNYSSEFHEGSSWYTQTARKVPEVADMDRWEALSRERPLFVLETAWLPATWEGKPVTVRRLLERIDAAADGPASGPPTTAADLARIVVNGGGKKGT